MAAKSAVASARATVRGHPAKAVDELLTDLTSKLHEVERGLDELRIEVAGQATAAHALGDVAEIFVDELRFLLGDVLRRSPRSGVPRAWRLPPLSRLAWVGLMSGEHLRDRESTRSVDLSCASASMSRRPYLAVPYRDMAYRAMVTLCVQHLIDREDERNRLVQAADEPPQLVVLRGRRRVGKSFLLERSLENHQRVSFQADEQDERGHLDLLAQEAARLLPASPPLLFADWDAALTFFADQAAKDPLVVVLDEFQWMRQAQPALPSILQRHWDGWQRDSMSLTVVLSGSALTLMEQLLDHASPLFGRANYRPLIRPLDYRFAAEFARAGVNPEAALQRYAVLGGTPQYQVWAGKGTLTTVIRDRILTKGESLYEEPLHLLREEQRIRDPGTYFAILKAIAGGATQFNAIQQQAHVEANLHTMLDRLEELGYIDKREAIEQTKKPRSTYRISDPFFRFWFRYVFPNRSRLERDRVNEVSAEVRSDLDTFTGLPFEDCCREWVGRYAPNSLLPSSEQLGSWWSRDNQVEIDVVGMTKGKYDLLGSCKWSTKMKASVLGELLDDRDHLGNRAANAQLALFARGFSDEVVERAEKEDVILVSAADLFA